MDTNTDSFVNNIQEDKTNDTNGFFNYISETFFSSNNSSSDDEYNDEDLINSYNNVHKLSQMNISQIHKYLNMDNLKNDANMYNNKYSNTLGETKKYETDYEIEIDKNEKLKFMRLKK